MNLIINNEKKFKCELCVYKTDNSGNLDRHFQNMHVKKRNFKCEFCIYTSKSNCFLNKHIKSAHINKYKCDECEYESCRKDTLKVHTIQVHLKIKEKKCNQCKMEFSRKCDLNKHIKTVHERPEESKRMSLGEFKIFTILNNYKVDFKKEFKFQDLISEKNGLLRFDFGIYNPIQDNFLLIEFDGAQHFHKVKWTKDDTEQQIKERFEYIQFCDKQKDKYVKDNNHHLLRIKYDDKDIEIKILEFLLSNRILLRLG